MFRDLSLVLTSLISNPILAGLLVFSAGPLPSSLGQSVPTGFSSEPNPPSASRRASYYYYLEKAERLDLIGALPG